MPIVLSVVIEDAVQKDGRRGIRERHTDHLGVTYDFVYMAEVGADANAQLSTHATQLVNDLANSEIASNLASAYLQGPLTFNYSTVAQTRAALRQAFKDATSWDVVRLGKFISGLGLSDAQLQSLFSVTAGAQLNALKTRLATLASHYDSVTSDQGQ